MTRTSPSSQLVLLVAGVAILVIGFAALAPQGPRETSSPSARQTSSSSPRRDASASPGVFVAAPTSPPNPTVPATPTATPLRTPPAGTPVPLSPPTGERSLPELLAMLEVAAEIPVGYDRALFPLWLDADGDGCDTRREVLIDEAVAPPSIGPGCRLSGGRWVSLYDGIVTTDPRTFDIDHVVALAEAWDSGASRWSRDRRTQFANDLDVDWALVAVSAASNRQKSDLDPARWLPSRSGARCEFLAMWLAVKVRWSLSADPIEQGAIRQQISDCPQRMAVALAP